MPLAPGLVWAGPGLKQTHLRFFTDLRISQGGRREGGGRDAHPGIKLPPDASLNATSLRVGMSVPVCPPDLG